MSQFLARDLDNPCVLLGIAHLRSIMLGFPHSENIAQIFVTVGFCVLV